MQGRTKRKQLYSLSISNKKAAEKRKTIGDWISSDLVIIISLVVFCTFAFFAAGYLTASANKNYQVKWDLAGSNSLSIVILESEDNYCLAEGIYDSDSGHLTIYSAYRTWVKVNETTTIDVSFSDVEISKNIPPDKLTQLREYLYPQQQGGVAEAAG